jgi:hypothetical protein
MRSPLCAESYTLRAIFSSLEPDRAKSAPSRAGSLDPTPSLFLFTGVRGRGILGTPPWAEL